MNELSTGIVRDVMHIGVANCRADTPFLEGVRMLVDQNLESVIVLDDNGHAVGVFGRQDAVSAYAQGCAPEDLSTLAVADRMRAEIPELLPDLPIAAAVQLMLDWGVRAAFIMHHHAAGMSWPAAVLRFEDVLRCVSSQTESDIEDMGVGAPRKTPMERFRDRYSKPE